MVAPYQGGSRIALAEGTRNAGYRPVSDPALSIPAEKSGPYLLARSAKALCYRVKELIDLRLAG